MKIKKILIIVIVLLLFLTSCNNKKEISSNEINTQQKININKQINKTSNKALTLSMRYPKTLNPLINEDTTVDNVLKLVFEPLFEINENLKPVPNLASSYKFNQDGTEITINMRQNIFWHDSKKITAEDVVFSLNTIKNNPNSIYKNALQNVISFNHTSNSVIIKYKEPFFLGIYNLCFPIIPSHYYKNNLSLDNSENFKPIGSGVFKFESYRMARELYLSKNTNFKGTPSIDKIKVIISPDFETDFQAFEQNIINAISLDIAQWGKLNYSKNLQDLQLTSNNFEFLAFNFKKPIFQNLNFRQAINYAINKKEISNTIYLETAVKTLTPIHPKSWLYIDIEDETNLETANQIFKNLTTPETLGQPLSILVNKENKERIETAENIINNLNSLGINSKILVLPFDEYLNAISNKNFDMFIGGIEFSEFPDIKNFLATNGNLNFFSYSNETMDNIINEVYTSSNEQNLINNIKQFQLYFKEQLPVIGILFKNKILLSDGSIQEDKDKNTNIYNYYNNFKNWYSNE